MGFATTRRERLTAKRIDSFECPPTKQQDFLWDSEVPGLGVRVTRNGAKSFIFQYRLHEKSHRATIGSVSAYTIDSRREGTGRGVKILQLGARDVARQWRQLIDQDVHPKDARAETRKVAEQTAAAERAKKITFEEAWLAYVADRKRHWSDKHRADHDQVVQRGGQPRKRSKEKTKPGVLAAFLDMRLCDITADVVEEWARKESSRATRARLGMRLMRAFAGWCLEHKEFATLVRQEAFTSKRAKSHLGEAARRDEVLQREQLSSWFAEVRGLNNPVVGAYLQFMLLTGQRPGEPLDLRWDQVNFKWRTIDLKNKRRGRKELGMTPYVARLLASLPRRKFDDGEANPWVFSSASSKAGALVDPGDVHDDLCVRAGLPHITLQGLRRTFSTLAEWLQIPESIVEEIQGRVPKGTRERSYVRRSVDLLRAHHSRYEHWLLRTAGVPVDASLQAEYADQSKILEDALTGGVQPA